ncbi:ABC transporter ATP-binding protein [Natronorubrum texcoconense]|uniref:Amino acid/amide ABC transporter ATP-binding protein 2, HAAT family n=1 Tax=Natronorubrum texcoconense TaxID=1095776 RepID=A0A1G9CZH7_9EURY|nr:ABC transporter ATP-binding protein [Natronorubrum texcoconense]SDK57111.1 amino acid/amide ABC transporter ATP-binding protein 2, HAAT family [Natronorubrum texcoconense]
MTVLDIDQVDSGYGDLQILHDVSMHLEEDEIVCIIGPNGAGKSTAIKTIFGLVQPWTGAITLRGTEISGQMPEDIVRQGISYVPQTDNVFSTLTVEENLEIGGVTVSDESTEMIEKLYDRFPILEEKRSKKARTLSGGQRQILAFSRALMVDPDVLLIDEPSAGLAPSLVQDVFENVKQINSLGTSVLMVEQNARAGLNISDRGYVLAQGQVKYEDDAQAILENPEIGELYLGG